MKINSCLALGALLASLSLSTAAGAPASAASALKEEMRQPWQRSNEDYLRRWLVLGPVACDLHADCLVAAGGETSVKATDGAEVKLAGGATLKWAPLVDYNDLISFDNFAGRREGAVAYAAVSIPRARAEKALLSVGSRDGIRAWLNGKQVLAKDDARSLTPDEDQVEIDLQAGDNTLLLKVAATSTFTARVLAPGALTPRLSEIGPSLIDVQPEVFTVRTDASGVRADAEPVKVEVLRPGGSVVFSGAGKRGERVRVPTQAWPDGPYEVRLTTTTPAGLLYATHLPFFKGDSLTAARALAAEAARADTTQPAGFTLKMLAQMIDDRLGVKLADATGNPWEKIHSPLMEFEELMLERRGETGRVRPHGFVRLAWTDEADGSPQYCRAYLPASYDRAARWPLVLQLHGYNPANPVYWRWWSADSRHAGIDTEFADHRQVIYIEVHGRGNVRYLGIGDSDVMRCLAEAKRAFSVDENRVYLTGDSMGGWGTWNVGTRHPDVFAAIAPVFGGVDYHAASSEEELAKLSPMDRHLAERRSSWAQAEGLLNVPVFVQHGDADEAVDVNWSRWGVKLLQRWGYDVRYREYPGRGHEALQHSNGGMSIDWLLQHERNPDPRHVRIRSAELRHAQAYWVNVVQAANPLDFMRVDAEVVDRNVIRIDTDNVLAVTLTPAKELIDAAKPIRIVWNGVVQSAKWDGGAVKLIDAAYTPGRLRKTARLPGGSDDFFVTPFALVIGTASKDAAMRQMCQSKAQAFIDGWRDAQKQDMRVFKDTEITPAQIAKYSLILVGGADANRVTAKFSGELPLRMTRDAVSIDGRKIRARDSVVQMIYPNPRNPERYVWVIAGQSADGMYHADVDLDRQYEWDYLVSDGLIPAAKSHASPLALNVTQGMFDNGWRYAAALEVAGDAQLRARGRPMSRPDPGIRIPAEVLASYVGKYQIDNGPLIEIQNNAGVLHAIADNDEVDLIPTGQAVFFAPKFNSRVEFMHDSNGKVTRISVYAGKDFEGRKLD